MAIEEEDAKEVKHIKLLSDHSIIKVYRLTSCHSVIIHPPSSTELGSESIGPRNKRAYSKNHTTRLSIWSLTFRQSRWIITAKRVRLSTQHLSCGCWMKEGLFNGIYGIRAFISEPDGTEIRTRMLLRRLECLLRGGLTDCGASCLKQHTDPCGKSISSAETGSSPKQVAQLAQTARG